MKKLTKIITIILALVVVFSCVACNDKDGETKKSTVEKMQYTGVHQFNATTIEDKYLVKDGQTEYTLVYPEQSDYLKLRNIARKEFLTFFNMATNISIPAITDAGLEHNDTNKYISLGDTTLLRSAGINPEEENDALNVQGVRIITKGNTIFIYGSTDYGMLYGVYTFMEMEFDFDFYYSTCYEINTDVSEVPLRQYDVKDVPDIRFRCPNYGFQNMGQTGTTEDEAYDMWRCRRNYSWNRWILQIHKEFDDINSAYENCHDVFTFADPSTYGTTHSKWFAGEQPCFTAHGDAAEYELMIQHYVKKIQNACKLYPVEENPWVASVHIGIMDGGGHCSCSTCSAVAQGLKTSSTGGAPNGSNSGAVILFVNEVAERVKYWMNFEPTAENPGEEWWDDYISTTCQPEWKRDLEFTFFAYGDYNDCPAEYNAQTKQYEPTSFTASASLAYLANENGVISAAMGEDVGVWYTNPANGSNSFYAEDEDPTKPNQARERMKMWGDLTDVIWIWGYSTNFSNFMVMSEDYAAYSDELYQAMQAAGVVGFFNNSQGVGEASTAFHLLKSYLEDKLSWNATRDTYELTIKFFKAMYKDGWQEMYEFFESCRTHIVEGPTVDLNFDASKPQSYSQNLVDQWLKLCDKAIEKNAKLKTTDIVAYNKVVNHINIEWVMPAYMTLNWFEENYSEDEIIDMKARLKTTVLDNYITNTSEHSGEALIEYVKGL